MNLKKLQYQIGPPFFLIFFTTIVQYLAIIGQGESFSFAEAARNTLGNYFAWKCTLLTLFWAILSMKVPATVIYGPETHFGYRPPYVDNGVLFYWLTLIFFFVIQAIYPDTSMAIFENMPQIIGSLNTSGLLLCLYLLLKGKYHREHAGDTTENRPTLYQFYSGVELHPHVFGADVKQLIICRVGMMLWQVYICAFYMAGVEKHGFNTATLINLLLQSVYIAKFFWWEAGYFSTIDMMLERAGYYLCWGCMVWVPCFYTYSSYYIVAHPSNLSILSAILLALIGLTSILLNYKVDYERQVFRSSTNHECTIWGKPANFIVAEYKDEAGRLKKTALLTSGFWGVGRRLNYTFELTAAFSWCACAYGQGIGPFLYFIFLTLLFIHRTIRDEDRCRKKYGVYWEHYCKEVKYKMIPYVW